MSKFKLINMTPREKALLTLIIAEIQGCQDMEAIKGITNSWVTANDLHPEEVSIFNERERPLGIQIARLL